MPRNNQPIGKQWERATGGYDEHDPSAAQLGYPESSVRFTPIYNPDGSVASIAMYDPATDCAYMTSDNSIQLTDSGTVPAFE